MAFRKPPNLRNQLCRARLPPKELPVPLSCGPCSESGTRTRGPHCGICKLIPNCTNIRSSSNGKISKLRLSSPADCNSKFVVYCITCTLCDNQYVGKAENFRLRVNNHKSCINRGKPNDRGCRVLYEHFLRPDHSIDNLSFTIVEKCDDAASLVRAERKWIWWLETVHPRGFNVDDGFRSYLHGRH